MILFFCFRLEKKLILVMNGLLSGVSKNYLLLTGNRNEAMGYHYFPSGQLNVSIFNLDTHTLHLKIVHRKPGHKLVKSNLQCTRNQRFD